MKKQFNYHLIYTQAKDSLFNEEGAREIGRLESKLELARKESELEKVNRANELNTLKLKQKRTQQQVFIGGSVFLVIILVYIIINQKTKKAGLGNNSSEVNWQN